MSFTNVLPLALETIQVVILVPAVILLAAMVVVRQRNKKATAPAKR